MIRRIINRLRSLITVVESDGYRVLRPCGDDWDSGSFQLRRSPASIFLPSGMFAETMRDLRTFLASQQWYAERGVPWRRCLLFEGQPGTGKTSMAMVLASGLGFDLAILLLTDPKLTDDRLYSLVQAVPDDTILLLEDIDSAWKPKVEGDKRSQITMPSLLNVMDGVNSRQGLITIATTNHPEAIDQAILRPGRVDRRIKFGYATRDMARQMFLWFFRDYPMLGSNEIEVIESRKARLNTLADQFSALIPDDDCRISPARIQEHLLRYRDDPDLCLDQAVVSGFVFESRPVEPANTDTVPMAVAPQSMPPAANSKSIDDLRAAILHSRKLR